MAGSSIIPTCPSCSRIIHFVSDQSNIIVCEHCSTTINKALTDGTLYGKPHYTISDKASLLQPGTTGSWQSKSFTILGRFRAWFDESVFNYWTVQFESGELSWLGEGYGIYSILKSTVVTPGIIPSQITTQNIGDLMELDGIRKFVLKKKYKTIRLDIEGELFLPDNTAAGFRLAEFSSSDGKNINFFEFRDSGIRAFEGHYVNFSDFNFQNIRTYDNEGKVFNCSSCKSEIHVKNYPWSQSCACTECGAHYAVEEGNRFVRTRSKPDNNKAPLYIPMGSIGMVNNIRYEVIGFVRKQEDNQYKSKWSEYTLYNAEEGFAFLSEYAGHWIYLREKEDSPVLHPNDQHDFHFNNTGFSIFNKYTHTVLSAQGEFPYNIFDNKNTVAREYIAPPEIWIQEKDEREGIRWFHGHHIDKKQIAASFPTAVLPYKIGVGAVQPPVIKSFSSLFLSAFAAVFFLLCLHTIIGFNKQERIIFDQRVFFADSTNVKSVVTEKFVLDKRSSNLAFTIDAAITNSWFELSATLVNAQTGKEYSLEKGIEYYTGYSDGESWNEGDRSGTAYLTRIPAGTYFIQLDGARENSLQIDNFYITIVYDVNITRNLLWSLFFVLIWPVTMYIISKTRESMRWNNSPYSTSEH